MPVSHVGHSGFWSPERIFEEVFGTKFENPRLAVPPPTRDH